MRSGFSLLLLIALSACSRIEPPEQGDDLVVAVRKAPAYYDSDGGTLNGFDHDLAQLFGQELGLKVRFVIARDPAELQELVEKGKVHLATSIAAREHVPGLRFTTPLRNSPQLLIQRTDSPPVEGIADFGELSIDVLAGSPQAELLQKINGTTANFKVVVKHNSNEFELFEAVATHQSEMAASDEDHFRIAQNFYPDLEVAYKFKDIVRHAWALPEGSTLFDKAQAFIERIGRDGTLDRINDRHFGHLHRVSDEDISSFLFRIETVLPRYRADFVAAQEATGIDWRLLAALAYQESRWDPLATSPTGVRGMMMLTGDTADRMRVTNRLDARQSIRAGGKYLADLMDQLPPEIGKPDRLWLALAAYNVGMGHMNGARAIAKSLKRDPNSWFEMKRVLPLLAIEQYYNRLKSGRGRGGEAVIMVENIRTYFDVLCRRAPAHDYAKLDFREFTPPPPAGP